VRKLNQIIVALVIFLIPFYIFRFSLMGIRTNVFEVAVLVGFLLSFPSYYLSKQYSKLKCETYILPLALLVSVVLAVSLSLFDIRSLGILKGWFLAPIVFAWLIIINFKDKELPWLSIPIFITLLMVSVLGILQKAGISSSVFYQQGDPAFSQYVAQERSFSIFESPNYLAMYIVPMSFLSLPLFSLFKKIYPKIILGILFLAPLFALYYCESRAGIVALIVAACLYVNYRYINLQKAKNRKPFMGWLFTIILLLVNVGYLFYSQKYWQPASDSDTIRVQIYHYSIEMLKTNYVSGIGLGDFQEKIALISGGDEGFRQFGLPYAILPHNLLLATWLYLGLGGLIVMLLLFVSFFKNIFSSDNPIRAVAIAAMIAVLIHGLFDTTYFKNDLSAIFWLIFSYSVIAKRKHEEVAGPK
jgi:putative inorganic carbon (HCO3(-)) transporter